jgi:hypothetical protein
VTGNGGSGNAVATSPIIFGAQDTGVLPNNLYSTGIRGTWGWFNPDDTGFVISGFMQNRGTSSYTLNDPLLVIDPSNGNYNPLRHLHAWFGLPVGAGGGLANGDTDGDGLYGAVIPYDMGVRISFTSLLSGANSDYIFNPVYEKQNMKIRPLAGVRYIRLREDFLFDAYDSGLGYTVNNTSTGSSSGGTGSSSGTSGVGYLTPAPLQTLFSLPNVLHSRLDSSTLSQMAGPEIGFRVDLGGKKFQLWGQTKVAALANVTDRRISGYGIGNSFNIISPNTVAVMPTDPTKTAFDTRQTTTSMSPMFEQSINFKVPVFNLVPYLNKMEIFERAQLQAGYTFLWIGDVYRPQNTIVWNQYPKTPQLNDQKSNFFNSTFNLGIEWQY